MDDNIFGTKRNIDIVFRIDGTGSMAPCIESVKLNARRFHFEYVSEMTDLGRGMDSMGVNEIVFRDYHDELGQTMVDSSCRNTEGKYFLGVKIAEIEVILRSLCEYIFLEKVGADHILMLVAIPPNISVEDLWDI